MKKQELIKIIELVVSKEVKKQMNEIFIKDNDSTSLTELVSAPLTKKEFKEPIRKKQVKPKKEVHYTSNESLNKILNETAGGVPQGDGSGYPTMGGEIYDTNKMNDVLLGAGSGNTGVSKEMKREIAAVDSIKRAGVSVDQVPDHVTNALTKDYRGLMKAIDQKKSGGYRP
jgi:hypothetical protein|tara:strand:- start:17 stop:529 length:513 start_codon:yes stop_codon:yes gene_type:complete